MLFNLRDQKTGSERLHSKKVLSLKSAGEMALQSRSLAALPEVPSLVPTTHIGFLTSVTPVQGIQYSLLASTGTVAIHMRMSSIGAYI